MDNKRMIFMISGGMDALLGAVVLLIYFGIIPIDLDIPRWIIGVLGGILFFSGVAVFTYFFTKSES
ncbi:MAG: hypothetical protein JNK81_10725 [Anaerolineales bacterium]|nr:hypothetical protein [Anaerolineales bacterium]